jgi:hypothetical protein
MQNGVSDGVAAQKWLSRLELITTHERFFEVMSFNCKLEIQLTSDNKLNTCVYAISILRSKFGSLVFIEVRYPHI